MPAIPLIMMYHWCLMYWAPPPRKGALLMPVCSCAGKEKGIGLPLWGLRSIEGGADNDAVYTFAWLTTAALQVGYIF
ncbi:hypothetical protein P3T73_05645 [Kiritimatiellota bacterium B12222]|nr:hypothetical protein P3T73_05645 [Kiritimatiellota bacterium B12222]